MSLQDVDGILSRAKSALSIDQDQELAEWLHVSRTTIASWRRRKSIPVKYLTRIMADGSVSFDWLMTGKGYPSGYVEDFDGDDPVTLEKNLFWLALLMMRRQFAKDGFANRTELFAHLTDENLSYMHIFLREFVEQLEKSKLKWLQSGLIKPEDVYRTLATEFDLGEFDSPPVPWWENEKLV